MKMEVLYQTQIVVNLFGVILALVPFSPTKRIILEFLSEGSLDFSYVGSRSVSESLGQDNWYYNTSILTIPTIKCGYWQRLGGDESPFLLEIELVRSDMIWGNTSVWSDWNEYRSQIDRIFLLTVGFRYEINNP